MNSLQKNTVTQEVYSRLREDIINRNIPSGRRISISNLSVKLGVSRTPLREVLRQLESEGILSYYPNKGFFLNTITIDDVEQVYAVRIVNEGLAGRLATRFISNNPQKLALLKKLCKEMEVFSRDGNIEAYTAKNIEFHSFIWHCSGNKWLIRILENLSSHLNRFIVRAIQISDRIEKSVREHWQIYKQFEIGNEKAVERAMATHFKNSSEALRKELIK